MSLGTTYSPTVPVGGATSYKLWPVFTYSNGYWEVYRRFQGDFLVGGGVEGTGLCGVSFPWRNLSKGKKFYEGGAGLFSIFFKDNEKIEYEKVFSTESKEQH